MTRMAKKHRRSAMQGAQPLSSDASAGQLAGSMVDAGIGLWNKWWGHGDYSIKSNSLMIGGEGAGASTATMSFGETERTIRVKHREYIGDVITAGTANTLIIQKYSINPGLQQVCPWLCTIAQNYQCWKPEGMIFQFVSTSSEFSSATTNALGTIFIACDYNVNDNAPQDKGEILQMAYSAQGKITDDMVHGIECATGDASILNYYVRSGPVNSTDSLKFYDIGNLYVATTGVNGTNVNIGSLYITYDIVFRKEQLFQGLIGDGLLWDKYYFSNYTPTNGAPFGITSLTGSQPGGGGLFLTQPNMAPGWVGGATFGLVGSSYVFTPWITRGTYLITVFMQGGPITLPVTGTAVGTNGATVIGDYLNNNNSPVQAVVAGTAASGIFVFMCAVKILNPIVTATTGAVVTFTFTAAGWGANTYTTVNVNQISGSYNA